MAKKTPTKATVTPIKKGSAPKGTPVRVRIESREGDAIYANYMEVGHSQYEFMIMSARIPTKLGTDAVQQAKERGEVVIEPEVTIIFPPRIISGLIKALEVQRDAYEATFGKIITTGEIKSE